MDGPVPCAPQGRIAADLLAARLLGVRLPAAQWDLAAGRRGDPPAVQPAAVAEAPAAPPDPAGECDAEARSRRRDHLLLARGLTRRHGRRIIRLDW